MMQENNLPARPAVQVLVIPFYCFSSFEVLFHAGISCTTHHEPRCLPRTSCFSYFPVITIPFADLSLSIDSDPPPALMSISPLSHATCNQQQNSLFSAPVHPRFSGSRGRFAARNRALHRRELCRVS